MDSDLTKVIIENLPKTHWYKEWVPIIIAIIALITSIISLRWTRKEFIKSSRPYVWASNYGVIDSIQKTIIPIPFRLGFRVKNNLARILRVDISIRFNSKRLFNQVIENIVRFPDATSEWTFSIGREEFEKIMSRSDADKRKLIREVKIKYSSLDGGKVYNYYLEQSFEPIDNQWKDINEKAD